MADRRLPYTSPEDSNVFLDAEDARVDVDGKTVLLQRVVDRFALPVLTAIRDRLNGVLDVNTGLTPLTDAQLRASGIPVALAQPLTNAQMRAAPVQTRDHHDDLAHAGWFFAAGGEATTSAVSPNASLSIRNPPGSGYNAVMHGYSVYADANATVRYYLGGTNTGALRTPVNYALGSTRTSVAEVRVGADTFNTTGATELSITSRVGPNAPLEVDDVHVTLPPGMMLTIRFIGPGATNLVVFNAKWYEEVTA